jgi:hypothetical protein
MVKNLFGQVMACSGGESFDFARHGLPAKHCDDRWWQNGSFLGVGCYSL